MDSNGRNYVKALPPPTDKKLQIKDKWYLVLEFAFLLIRLIPLMFLAGYRKLYGKAKSLHGQVALVTGAGRGLGRGLSLALAQEGCRVAVADINLTAAEEVAEEIRQLGGDAKAYCCNVARVEEVRQLRAAITSDLGSVDLLVNNAGLILFKSLLEVSPEEVSETISVNLLSHFWMVKEFLPPMIERNSGHIVAISSLTSYIGGEDRSVYAASKFGVTGFMECVRAELKRIPNNNIKTTTICPYFINTSADYVEGWDLRVPPMSIRKAVKATIAGIKREEVTLTIPEHAHYVLHFVRLLPQAFFDMADHIFYTRYIPPTTSEKTPTSVIIENLVANKRNS